MRIVDVEVALGAPLGASLTDVEPGRLPNAAAIEAFAVI